MIKAFLLIFLFICTSAKGSDYNVTDSFLLKTGLIHYQQFGIDPKSNNNYTNATLEWDHFIKHNYSSIVSYKIALDASSSRTMYQAGSAGLRFFPFTLGAPIKLSRGLNFIKYDFLLKPYVEMGASLGRYLIKTFGKLQAFDASSEFYGIYAGTGTLISISEKYAIDINLCFEYENGYGPLEFSAVTFFGLMGFLRYL